MSDAKTDFTTSIPARIAANTGGARNVGAVFVFKINGEGGGVWTLNLKDNPGVTEGAAEGADCTLELAAEDWRKIMEDPKASMGLYFQGKLKVSGNVMLATKLQQVLGG